MERILDIVLCWRNNVYESENCKNEALFELIALLEINEPPAIEGLYDVLTRAYQSYVLYLFFTETEDENPEIHARYARVCERVRATQSGAGRRADSSAGNEFLRERRRRLAERVPTPFPRAVREDSPEPGTSSVHGGLTDRPPTPHPSASRRRRLSPDRGDDEQEEENGPTVELVASSERYLRLFKTSFREETFHVTNLRDKLLEDEVYMTSLFDELLQRQIQKLNAKENDRCILEIRGNDDNRPIFFHLRPINQLSGRVILDKLIKTLNSNENFMAGVFHLSFIHIPTVSGSGRDNRRFNTTQSWLSTCCKNVSMYDPKNTDDKMCLTRCISYLQLSCNVTNRRYTFTLRNPNNREVYQKAKMLCAEAEIDENTVCGYDECHKVQLCIKERLVVFLDRYCRDTFYVGSRTDQSGVKRERTIFLYYEGDHYYGVCKIKPVTGYRQFCYECLTGYYVPHSHRCTLSCERCEASSDHKGSLIECQKCYRYFAGKECLESHLVKQGLKSVCDVKKYCKRCGKFYNLDGKTKVKKHICGRTICKYCNEYMPDSHKCYMTPWEPKKLAKKTRYMRMYFDIETRQNDDFEKKDEWKEHKANLLVCQQMCDKCENDTNVNNDCNNCGKREHIFKGFQNDSNVVSEFLNYLQLLCSERKTHITIFAHNFKSFDGYFIIQELLNRNVTPKVKLSGAKILSLKTQDLHFKDSLMFLPQSLASLPKAFGLTELKKGYFCHLANTEEYYDYTGSMPPRELYCSSVFKDSELIKFNNWYDEQVKNKYVFNFKKEILAYCQSDVTILREAMESFRTLFMESAGFDPLMHCITLSAACMCNFRMNHLRSGALGIVPRGGYRGSDRASYVALKWLSYESHVLGKKIQHAENSREVHVLGHPVDGYVEIVKADGSLERRILNFHGCFFHSHTCLSETARSKIRGRSKEDPYERTKHITEKFRKAGYVVIEKWGCEFQHDLTHDKDVINYFKNNPFTRVKPLNLRDALCGGRTSALYSEYQARLDEGETIKFFDVISEYPACMYFRYYPEGHPTIYLEGDPCMPLLKDMNGVILATVLPPRDLFLPVLPFKCCNKLMFPLCRTCAETMNQESCHHSDKERELRGTWCAPEFQLAVKKGYIISAIHEVYQYPHVKGYNPQTGTDGLFTSYVRQNMAMKIEASGWPSHAQTDEEKDAFIHNQLMRDGIKLDKTKFEKNPGKRTLAKLILNSFCESISVNI